MRERSAKLLFFDSHVSHDNFRKLAKDNWRLSPASAPAAMMTAVGIHHTDLFIHIAGPPAEVRARSTSMIFEPPAEDFVSFDIVFKSGVRATFSALSITPFYGRFALFGDKGWVEIVSLANVDQGKPTILTHGDHSGRRVVSYEDTDTVTKNFEVVGGCGRRPRKVSLHRRGADREHPAVRGDRHLVAE